MAGVRPTTPKVGFVPARALEAEACCSHLFFVGFMPARRAMRQSRIGHLLQHVLLMPAVAATIYIDRHNLCPLILGRSDFSPYEDPLSESGRKQHADRPAGSDDLQLNELGRRNRTTATSVGKEAARKSLSGEIVPSEKQPFRMEKPAGLGALAMTVSPPPVTAPATSM